MKILDENLNTAVFASAPRPSLFWLGYLLAAIAFVGAPGCAVVGPFIAAGRFYRPLELWAGRVACVLIRIMFWLNFWITKDVRLRLPWEIGRTNRPTILVANHRSNLDVFFLISYIPNIRILAKRSLFFVPFLGVMMWVMRQIPVQRGRLTAYLQALETARTGLRRGDPVLFFAEGQRCERNQRGTRRFYPAAFSLAKEEGVPIYPVVFAGTDIIWPKGSAGLAAGGTARVTSLEPLYPDDFPSAHAMMGECQKRMNRALESMQ